MSHSSNNPQLFDYRQKKQHRKRTWSFFHHNNQAASYIWQNEQQDTETKIRSQNMHLLFQRHHLAHFLQLRLSFTLIPNLLACHILTAPNKLTERIRPLCGEIAQSNDNMDCHKSAAAIMASSSPEKPR